MRSVPACPCDAAHRPADGRQAQAPARELTARYARHTRAGSEAAPGRKNDAVGATGGPPRRTSSVLGSAHARRRGTVRRFTGEGTPRGCLIASALVTGSDASQGVRAEATAIRAAAREGLRVRIERDIEMGLLPGGTDADTLAATVLCGIQGLSVLARDGVDRPILSGIVDQLLAGWPR